MLRNKNDLKLLISDWFTFRIWLLWRFYKRIQCILFLHAYWK